MKLNAAALGFAVLGCASCVPWTVRPIEPAEDSREQESFTAAAYVDSIWTARLLPAIESSAVDLSAAQGASAPHRAVRGIARVLSVDTSTQSGVVRVDLLPPDGKADALIQIGPVIRGTSLRDAAGFIEFGQFANQIQFADVANELNARVLRDVVPRVRAVATRGAVISFTGTYANEPGELPRVVPVNVERAPERLP